MTTAFARAIEGIPVLGSTTERDLLFPLPQTDQRYEDRTSGVVYRYDGAKWAWNRDGVSGGGTFDPRAWGAVCDGVADDTAAIQAAIDAVKPLGGRVRLPWGTPRTTNSLNVTRAGGASGVAIIIEGYGPRTTMINAQCTGKPVFDCTGSSFLTFANFAVSGNSSLTPTCAFLLARNNTAASAGDHIFRNVHTLGNFSQATLYNYGSEVIRHHACQFANSTVGKPVVCITQANVFGLTSSYATILTGPVSTTCFDFDGCEFFNSAAAGNNDCVYVDGVSQLAFEGACYMYTAAGRAFVYIDATARSSSNIDLGDTMWDGGNTNYGVTVAGAFEVSRLTLANVNDNGVKPFAGTPTAPTGGITVYGQDGSLISNVRIENVNSGCAYYRFYQINYGHVDLNALDTLYLKYACAGNRLTVASTKFVVDRPDFATGNMVYFLDTGAVSNIRQSLDNGDASKTLAATDAPTQRWATPLTANRLCTLPANNVSAIGQRFTIVRTGTGTFSLTVQDAAAAVLKVLNTPGTVVVEFNGTNWALVGASDLVATSAAIAAVTQAPNAAAAAYAQADAATWVTDLQQLNTAVNAIRAALTAHGVTL